MSFDFKAKRFVDGAMLPPENGHFWWKVIFTEEAKRKLYGMENGRMEDSFLTFQRHFSSCQSDDLLARLQYVDTKVYLPDDILVKTDRMSMANSLELRVPLLDHRLVEFASRLPARMKVTCWNTKVLLRQVLRTMLPSEVVHGRKRGFSVPLSRWLRGAWKDLLDVYLSEDAVAKAGYFNWPVVRLLVREHLSGHRDHGKELWTLICLEVWRQQCLKG